MDVDGLMVLMRCVGSGVLMVVRNVGRPTGIIPLVFDDHWLRFTEPEQGEAEQGEDQSEVDGE
jgi:hypothetical protein